MKKVKTSRKETEILNPGSGRSAKITQVGNPSGLDNLSLPQGRGEPASDHSQTEKQNQ
jgi:hypothetical protein